MTPARRGDSMHHAEGEFIGAGGLALHHQHWRPATGPRGIVALVHGVGEHSGRYMNVVEPLVGAGYVVWGYDHRGHGDSLGPRVHIARWAQYREDFGAFLGMVTEQMPDSPLFLYGHSMGSLVVLDYLMEHSPVVAGTIISGAPLVPSGVGSRIQITMARALSGIVPRCPLNLGIDATSLTCDPEAQEAFRADSKVTGHATVRWSTETLDTIVRIKEGMKRINVPLLMLHGEADPLNMVDGAYMLFAAAPHPDKTLRIYPGVRHEPHNDLDHDQIAGDIREWLAHLIL